MMKMQLEMTKEIIDNDEEILKDYFRKIEDCKRPYFNSDKVEEFLNDKKIRKKYVQTRNRQSPEMNLKWHMEVIIEYFIKDVEQKNND